MPSNESGSGASESGGIRVQHYYRVGPDVQSQGFGWSLGSWGGTEVGAFTTVLSSDINASTTSIMDCKRCITITKLWNKLYKIGQKKYLHRYIYKHLTGVTRGVRNTTAASHTAGAQLQIHLTS